MISGSTIHIGDVRRKTLVIKTLVYSSDRNSSSRFSESQKPAMPESNHCRGVTRSKSSR